jgi:hypothetical protein
MDAVQISHGKYAHVESSQWQRNVIGGLCRNTYHAKQPPAKPANAAPPAVTAMIRLRTEVFISFISIIIIATNQTLTLSLVGGVALLRCLSKGAACHSNHPITYQCHE